MQDIYHTYVSLLADIARLSGYSEIRGLSVSKQWCLLDAPQLEKTVLRHLELLGDGRLAHLNGNPSGTSRRCLYCDSACKPDRCSLVCGCTCLRKTEADVTRITPEPLKRLVAASLRRDATKLRLLRQVLLFCHKALITHDTKTTAAAIERYATVQTEVEAFASGLRGSSPLLLHEVTREVRSVLFRGQWGNIIPGHGPGASTTPKYRWKHWYESIERVFPYSDYMTLYHNRDHLGQLPDEVEGIPIEAKLHCVPKDVKGPRLIAVHPAEAIWIQQGLRRELERVISLQRDRRQGRVWPHGHIFFDDQSVNGKIALLSSTSLSYATIDMKDASDRLSESLIAELFGPYYKYFECCRAQTIRLPSGKILKLSSYAPMGNATVFPVQSLVFWAICVATLRCHCRARSPGAAYVFGDDILVPTKYVYDICRSLQSFGLVVNDVKSFATGHFRESCGVDAFYGVDVTPIRWKAEECPKSLVALQALSDMAMRLRIAGYDEAACTTYSILWKRFWQLTGKTLFFTNNVNHGGIAEYSPRLSLAMQDAVWHKAYQWYFTPVWIPKTMALSRPGCDWNHVLESLCSLERSGRANVQLRPFAEKVVLTTAWTRVE